MKQKHGLLITLFTALATSMESDPEEKGMTTSQLRQAFEKVHPGEGCPTSTQIKRAADKILTLGYYEGTERCYVSKYMGLRVEAKSLKRKLADALLDASVREGALKKEIRKLKRALRPTTGSNGWINP